MSDKFKIKLMELATLILFIIAIFAVYKFYTRQVGLYDVLNKGIAKSIFVNIMFIDKTNYNILDESSITLNQEEEIDEIFGIINKYKYSKIPRVYKKGHNPANYSNGIIDCMIVYDDNKILHQQVSVYSDNEVRFCNKNGKCRNYMVVGNDDKLFDVLLEWINKR